MGTDRVAYDNDKITNPEISEQTKTSTRALARDNQRGVTTSAGGGAPPSELHADPIFSAHQAPDTGVHPRSTGDLPTLPGSTPHEFALHDNDSSFQPDASGDAHNQKDAQSGAGGSPWRTGAVIPGDGEKTGAVTPNGDKTGAVTPDGDKTGAVTPDGDKIGAVVSADGQPAKVGDIAATSGGSTNTGFDSLLSNLSPNSTELGSSTPQTFGTIPNETGPYTVATDVTQVGSLTLLPDTTELGSSTPLTNVELGSSMPVS